LHVSLCTSSWICVEKRQKEEEKDEIPLENVIERKHSALHPNVTKITLESFLAWKKRKRQEKKSINLNMIWKEEKLTAKQRNR
jgi:hypothetical protein